ncbi:MAG: DUF1232 domain-containing protein [Armatimonadetes bacterium]|nr:DUF1232 domain-containing protein [Armatimonadota bacterium]
MFQRLKSISRSLKTEIAVYRLVLKDPRTPLAARVILSLAVGYALSPLDIIPDFIPIVGHLDDVLIVPGLVFLALRLTPSDIVDDCRRRSSEAGP